MYLHFKDIMRLNDYSDHVGLKRLLTELIKTYRMMCSNIIIEHKRVSYN